MELKKIRNVLVYLPYSMFLLEGFEFKEELYNKNLLMKFLKFPELFVIGKYVKIRFNKTSG